MDGRPLGNHRSSEKWENRIYKDESNPIRSISGGRVEFRFPTMSIGRVKFIVLRSNDRKIAGKSMSTVTEMSAARIVEIEATGSESVDKIVENPESDESEDELNSIMQ